MTEKYYRIRIGSDKVNGSAIKVNPDAERGERFEDVTDSGRYEEFKFIRVDKKGREVYDYIFKNLRYSREPGRDSLGGQIGVAAAYEVGKPDIIKLAVSKIGKLELISSTKKVFIDEITKKKAEDMRESAVNWALMRAYIFE